MNKILTKQILTSCGVPTAKYIIKKKEECRDLAEISLELAEYLGFPMVLKSPCQGSSIGVVIVKESSEIESALNEVFKYGDRLLAEEFLNGVELTLPIIGNEKLTVLPDIEITSENEFYDYQAKYTSGMCQHIIPSRISEADRDMIRRIGVDAYRALDCCGLSRIDFIVDKEKGPMVIEVNTLPGMTEMSLFPDSARYSGLSFEDLVLRIAELGYNIKR